MDSLKPDLQRAADRFTPKGDALDSLTRRRHRRQVRTRVAAAAIALVVAIAGIGLVAKSFRASPAGVQPAAGPGVNGRIAFTGDTDHGWHLYTADPDGSDVREITTGVRDYNSSWSPDGSRLVVGREGGIYVMNADGSDPVKIADASGSSVDWSPTGDKILFENYSHQMVMIDSGSGGSASHIFVVNVDGTGLNQLTDGARIDWGANWSPDGSKILFSREDGPEAGIHVMNPDGSGERLISGRMDTGPHWSPDGSSIVFSREGADPFTESIFTMNADGTGARQLTNGGADAYDFEPAYSPDGTKIVFTRQTNGEGHSATDDIWTMDVNGGDLTQITHDPAENDVPSWGTAPVVSPAG